MAPRAFGALFALVAALAFATALAGGLLPATVPGWWDGHPTVQGKQLERKAIHVGLLGAIGCNYGEQVTCETVPTGHSLEIVGIAEAALLGLGFVTALIAMWSMWKMGDRRKFFGKLLLFEFLLIAGGAGAIFLHGPDLQLKMQIGIPVGIGLYAVIGGSVLAFLAGVIGMRLEPEPLRLKTSEQRIQQPHQQQPAFDVRELLRDNQQGGMRVSQPHMMPPSPGGPLPGPGPLGGHMGPPPQHQMNHQPLFESAPHLRPLYDMQNAGAVPSMPPPLENVTPPTHGPFPNAPAPGDSASLHVPLAPYSPPRSIEQTEDLERHSESSLVDPDPIVEPPRARSGTRPPPYVEAPTTPRAGNPNAGTAAARIGAMPRAARPSVPPPRTVAPSKHPTLATAVPPMPSAHVEPKEPSTNVEIDAEAKAQSRALKDRPSDLALTTPIDRHSASGFDHTDESVIAPPLARPEQSTDENPLATQTGDATSENQVLESFEDIETRDANNRFSPRDLGLAETDLAESYRPLESARTERARAPSGGAPANEEPTAVPPPPAPAKVERPPASRTAPPTPWGTSNEAPTAFSAAAKTEAPTAFAPASAKSATAEEPPRVPKPEPIRAIKPSVSPLGAKLPSFVVPNIAPPNGSGKPPSNLEPTATTNKATTTTTPSPFATIPSPFGPKPMTKPDEQVTRPTPRQKRASSEQPTAHAPVQPFDGEHEAPTRAVGGNPPGVGIHEAATSAGPSDGGPSAVRSGASLGRGRADHSLGLGPDPAIAPPRRWRASSEVPTSHSGTTTGEEPSTGRPSETTLKSPPRPEGGRSPVGDQASGTIRDRDAHEAPTVSARDGRPVTNRAADVPMSTAPQSLPPPKKAPQVSSGPTPACPQCEAPMLWVEEHLRFYCASCRMYF